MKNDYSNYYIETSCLGREGGNEKESKTCLIRKQDKVAHQADMYVQ